MTEDLQLESWERRFALLTLRAELLAATADDCELPLCEPERKTLRQVASVVRELATLHMRRHVVPEKRR